MRSRNTGVVKEACRLLGGKSPVYLTTEFREDVKVIQCSTVNIECTSRSDTDSTTFSKHRVSMIHAS